eukprot:Phypoly_transcript_08508.p1 GENE.Phypoly_transcript_08508~~Phypoly_transcript_08508.p1  ORF type:complete len:299 (+),score=46.01 Phypoly_transcript_08508:578-1474(+)
MTTDNDPQLTPEEQAALASFAQKVRQDPHLASLGDDKLVQFMMARKFEEARAYELLLNSLKWRRDRGIGWYLPINRSIANELKTKKVLIPPLSRDKEGSQVVYYRPGLGKKHATKPEDFCLSVFYLLQRYVRDPSIQRKGFLFICDLRGTKLMQVDRKLVKSILDMLSNKFPARLKKVLLLEPPGFFNVAFRIIRPLIPAKYLEKIATAHLPDLQVYVDADKLLPDFGGRLQFDPIGFVDQLLVEEQQMQVQQLQHMEQTHQETIHQQQVPNTPQNAAIKSDSTLSNPAAMREGMASS